MTPSVQPARTPIVKRKALIRTTLICTYALFLSLTLKAQINQTFLFPDTLHAKGLKVHYSFDATCPPVGTNPYDSNYLVIDSVGGDAAGLSWVFGAKNSRFIGMGDYSDGNIDQWANQAYIDTLSSEWLEIGNGSNAEWHDMCFSPQLPKYKVNTWVHHEGGATPMISISPHGNYMNYQLAMMYNIGWYIGAGNYLFDSTGVPLSGKIAFIIDTGGNAQFQALQLDSRNSSGQVMYFANNSLPSGSSTDNLLTDSAGFVRHIPASSITGGGNYIINGTSPQTAHYSITNTNTNSTSGEALATASDNYTWSSNSSPSGGALYTSHYNNQVHNFNSDESIGNSVTMAAEFNRLTLNSGANSSIDLSAGGTAPRALTAEETQVYLPNISSSTTLDSVSDVASLIIKSAYQDAGTTNSVKAINFYQLLIESSSDNIVTDCLENTYGIYQCGVADTNILKGPLNYTNKYSSSAQPSATTSTGAGTSGSASVSGTNDGGVLTLITGSSPAANATIETITFSNSFSFPKGCSVVLFPGNGNAAKLTGAQAVYTVGQTGNWTITSGTTALAASTTYIWNYQISGY